VAVNIIIIIIIHKQKAIDAQQNQQHSDQQ
jgi:hypothetical protein